MRARTVVLSLALLTGAGIAGTTHVWREATALPEWYVEGEDAVEVDEVALESPERPVEAAPGESNVLPAAPAPGEAAQGTPPAPRAAQAKSKRREVRQFHRHGVPPGTRTPIKASRAVLDGKDLEAGVVLDLSNVPREQLSSKDRAIYDRAILAFPALARRDVYVGIEDEPQADGGVLRLGPNPKVRVGNLRYPLDKVAEKLGIPPDELRRDVDRELARLGLQSGASR